MGFIKRATTFGHTEIKDFKELKTHGAAYLFTEAGMLILACSYQIPILRDKKGRMINSPYSYPASLSMQVIVTCCDNMRAEAYYHQYRCASCKQRFVSYDSLTAIEAKGVGITKAEWLTEEDFIAKGSPALSQTDSFEAILWAQDLYKFLRRYYGPMKAELRP